jgi:hypothetical protein
VPEYEVSSEARWLTENWSRLQEFAGRWIVVVADHVAFTAPTFQEAAAYADSQDLHPLFAFVAYDDFA